ncbi:hypothetical protein [Parachitinimonas caeni]|uniref:Uncharacterized protein n=1 Tax=Parachitinimonas caeni TaxID=3031301 RepID=A0ABT7DW77_9NEIS|nr:hypothetical protein [Parachitinimonas caeni]MDK2124244.1 hypothetical protein [Parachitinimonas caeni]
MKKIRLTEVSAQLGKVQEAVHRFAQKDHPLNLAALQALLLIDEQAQPAFDLVRQQYIQNPRMSKQIEEKLWQDIVGFSRDMLAAYQRFVLLEEPKPEEASEFQKLTAIMLARALHYISIQMKWHFFRFSAPDPKLWSAAHQIYRLSEVSDVDSDPFSLYPALSSPTTSCADEYVQIMMLATLNNGNFSFRQFDWADRWLDSWSRHIQIERKYRANVHQFCLNLQEPAGPSKIHDQVDGETMRYWGVIELLAEMTKIIKQLEAGESPQRLGLGDDCRMPGCLDFMKQLEILWSRELTHQIHRSERHKVNKLVEVVQGLNNIFQAIRQDDDRIMSVQTMKRTPESAEVMDMKLYGFVTDRTKQRMAEMQNKHSSYAPRHLETVSWVLENQSEGGFGAVLPVNGNDWVRLGVLVGMRNDANSNWILAVIRRLNRIDTEHLYAGLQILSTASVSVTMRSEDEHRRPSALSMSADGLDTFGAIVPRLGLYIPHQTEGKRINTMLIQAADYSMDRFYHVTARDKHFTVKLGDMLEKGPDWIWSSVDLLRKD